MAKKIKFPLQMANGSQVRTIEELQENFDLKTIITYFLDGKLAIWISDRYYDNESRLVNELSSADEDLAEKLCSILGVEYNASSDINVDSIMSDNDKINKIKQFTDLEEILSSINIVATNQNELLDILENGEKKVYLCGTAFVLPLHYPNVEFIGINNPVVDITDEHPELFYKNNLSLRNIKTSEKLIEYSKFDERYIKAEENFIKHNMEIAKPLVEELCEEGNPRAFALSYWIYYDLLDNTVDCLKYVKLGYEMSEPICTILYALFSNAVNDEKKKNIFKEYKRKLKAMDINGDVIAKYVLGLTYINQTDEEIDYPLAVKYFTEGTRLGHYRSYFSLAKRYVNGQGVEQSLEIAHTLYLKSAEMGHSWSMYEIARDYELGYGVEKSEEMAFKYYLESGNQHFGYAENELSGTFYSGWHGQAVDYDEAIKWTIKAANKGHTASINRFGLAYWRGHGIERCIDFAIEYFEKASANGDMYGARNLGTMYYEGVDVPKDWDKAKHYLSLAVERGHTGANEYLDIILGKPTAIENVITKIESIHKTTLWSQSFFTLPKIDTDKRFRSKSSCEDYIYGQLAQYAQDCSNAFSLNNDKISNYVIDCQNKINDAFTELHKAFVQLSVDIDISESSAACEELKYSLKQGIGSLLADSYYSTYDIWRDVTNIGYDVYEEGNIHQHYRANFCFMSYISKEADEKWSKLTKDCTVFVKQLLQPAIMELKTICEELKNNR